MPIPDRRITNLASFQEVTEGPRQIAGLYFYQLLDCLVDLAFRVSVDFRRRPQLYKDLGRPSLAEVLATLNAKYGTEVEYLSASERGEIYTPIFGNWNSSSAAASDNFARLRDGLVQAVVAFVEGAGEHGVPMLREGIVTSHKPFRDYLLGLEGDSTKFSKDVALAGLTEKTCYPILRSQVVAAIFGGVKLAGVEYPYATDPAEDVLVEQISGELKWAVNNVPSYSITRERISNLQRTALRGAEAIATALDFEGDRHHNTDADLNLLITKFYNWNCALINVIVPKASPQLTQQIVSPPPSVRSSGVTVPPLNRRG
jgi:hypothetical protein